MTGGAQGGVVWEPWTPEVGQRVRVRMSSECVFCVAIRSKTASNPDGLTGVMLDPNHSVGREIFEEYGHGYAVRFDEPLLDHTAPNWYWLTSRFAAAELIPLEPSPDNRRPAGETDG